MFACKMYNPDLSEAERQSRVNDVLTNLGLESCRDTKVRQFGPSALKSNVTREGHFLLFLHFPKAGAYYRLRCGESIVVL